MSCTIFNLFIHTKCLSYFFFNFHDSLIFHEEVKLSFSAFSSPKTENINFCDRRAHCLCPCKWKRLRQTVRGFVAVYHRPAPFNISLRLTEIHTAYCETYGTDLYGSHSVVLATK
jgi:hypothetical protein